MQEPRRSRITQKIRLNVALRSRMQTSVNALSAQRQRCQRLHQKADVSTPDDLAANDGVNPLTTSAA
jgi:hypothetical protein